MIHIGEDLGVTGNGLKKICIKQNIPRPPAGYFQMSLENRRRVHRSLPNAESDPEILIPGVLPNELSAGVDDVVLPESNDATVEKQIDAYIKHLRSNSTTGERGILYPRNQRPEYLICCSKDKLEFVADRFKLILSTLKANGCTIEFRLKEHQGFADPTTEVYATLGRVSQKLRVEETATRIERPLTATELKQKKRHEDRGLTYYRSNPWIYAPTGNPQMMFGFSRRRILRDDIRPAVSAVLNDLRERDDRERRWEIERRQARAKYLLSLRKLRRELWDEKQLAAVENEAARWTRATQLRHYLSAVESADQIGEAANWLELARRLVAQLDPLASKTFARVVAPPTYKETARIADERKRN